MGDAALRKIKSETVPSLHGVAASWDTAAQDGPAQG